MKAILVETVGGFEMREVAVPRPRTGEVLVKVSVAGLCRTDLKLIREGHRDLVLPRIPGEEVVGTVAEPGAGAVGVAVGDRVYVYPGTSCGGCGPCMKGAGNLCRSMEIMGFHRHGGFAEYVAVSAESLIPVPAGVPCEDAVFAEPLSCCINALELSRLSAGEGVGIWGAGPAGRLLQRAATAMQAECVVIDSDRRRATSAGGVTSPPAGGFDVCVVAVGSVQAYREALLHLKPRGRLVAFSGVSPNAADVPIDLNRLHYLEQTLVGAYGCSRRHGEMALALIERGVVQVRDLVSHRLPLGELGRALEMVERRDAMKILLYPTTSLSESGETT